ncbi:MAG: hypothetical protein U9N59_10485 [Campylobacterota bacterium]|nr:hypothetical protein [Campylobacterota bacterium]
MNTKKKIKLYCITEDKYDAVSILAFSKKEAIEELKRLNEISSSLIYRTSKLLLSDDVEIIKIKYQGDLYLAQIYKKDDVLILTDDMLQPTKHLDFVSDDITYKYFESLTVEEIDDSVFVQF